MASQVKQFWKTKAMVDFSEAEWESVCDGCGRCCLQKLEDDATGEVYYTDLVCRYYDEDRCRCTDYQNRSVLVPQCVKLRYDDIEAFHWLPSTCAYKLLHDHGDLPPWHPLQSGDGQSVIDVGVSIKGKVVSEAKVDERLWEEHIITWVD